MGWLFELHKTQPIAHAVGVLSFVCVLGMALGSVKFRGIGLGTSGVLFAGILVGHFGEAVDHHTLDFVKEFGLILFVFTIGLQLGPGIFAALRQQGVRMNVLAAAIVMLGALSAPLIGWLAGFDAAAVLGIFSGASTNTPSLGAGTQTLSTLPGIAPDRLTLPALAYAVTYPTAIVAIIGALLLLKQIFRIDPAREAADFAAKNRRQVEPLERRTLVVTNPNLEGIRLDAIPGRIEARVTISRHLKRKGKLWIRVFPHRYALGKGDRQDLFRHRAAAAGGNAGCADAAGEATAHGHDGDRRMRCGLQLLDPLTGPAQVGGDLLEVVEQTAAASDEDQQAAA